MRVEDIAEGTTYTDGVTAVRTVTRITSVPDGRGEVATVLCKEHAGLNRNRVHSIPLDTFAEFAVRVVAPDGMAAAADTLGLAAYPIDLRTRAMIEAAPDGSLRPSEPGDVTLLEKLVGLGLARRDGKRFASGSYQLGEEILAIAGRRHAAA